MKQPRQASPGPSRQVAPPPAPTARPRSSTCRSPPRPPADSASDSFLAFLIRCPISLLACRLLVISSSGSLVRERPDPTFIPHICIVPKGTRAIQVDTGPHGLYISSTTNTSKTTAHGLVRSPARVPAMRRAARSLRPVPPVRPLRMGRLPRPTTSQETGDPSAHQATPSPSPDRVGLPWWTVGASRSPHRIAARLAAKWRDTALLCPYDGAVMRHTGPASARMPSVQAYTCRGKKHRVPPLAPVRRKPCLALNKVSPTSPPNNAKHYSKTVIPAEAGIQRGGGMGLCRWSVNSAKLPEDSHPNTPTQDGQPEYINPAKDPYAYFKHPDAKKGMSESVRECQGIPGVSFCKRPSFNHSCHKT